MKALKITAIATALSLACVQPTFALRIVGEPDIDYTKEWGSMSGGAFDASPGGAGDGIQDLPPVTVTGSADGGITPSDVLYPAVVITGSRIPEITVVSPVASPRPREPEPEDLVAKNQCIADCDNKQKIANDVCAIAAAKASAQDTEIAIGVGFAVGIGFTWKMSLLIGAPAGYAAYLITHEIAKDFSATANLACLQASATAHISCIQGKCHA